jgi:predicted RNA binding protein YcfA (HicA-like mRNA interferase family)
MNNTLKPSVSSKELIQLLKSRGFKTRQTGSHVIVESPTGATVIPLDAELSSFMVGAIRKELDKLKIMSYPEFDKFISEQFPLMGRVFEQIEREDQKKHFYANLKDELLKKRLLSLGSSPMDTLIREAGVVLEDRLRQVSHETTDLHGVALVDVIFAQGKEKIKFSAHPGEQDGARLLFRGAIQFIRNPAMHKLIDYPESDARNNIQIIDSLLQLLLKAEYIERTNL